MSNFNVERSALKTNESHEISRSTLRTLDGPWVRSPLRTMDETLAGDLGNLAGRAAGAIFNTQGHRLRQAAKARQYRDQMRQHYSDSPEAMKHLDTEFQKQAADQAQKATHGRFSRFLFGDPSKRGEQHPPQTSNDHGASPIRPPEPKSAATSTPGSKDRVIIPAPKVQGKTTDAINKLNRMGGTPQSIPSAPVKKTLDPARLKAKAQSVKTGSASNTAAAKEGEAKQAADVAKAKADAFKGKVDKLKAMKGAAPAPKAKPTIQPAKNPTQKPTGRVLPMAPAAKRPDVNVGQKKPEGRPSPATLGAVTQQAIDKLKAKRGRVMSSARPTPAANVTAKPRPTIVRGKPTVLAKPGQRGFMKSLKAPAPGMPGRKK